jgi:cytochrome c
MQKQSIVLAILMVPLLVGLYGCQPEIDAQQSSAYPPGMSDAKKLAWDDAVKLARDTGCFACHSIDKKLLGPAWKNVAGINRGNPDAEAKLMDKIAKGGSGVWGKIDMPAYPRLSEANRRVLVKFILSLE